MKDASGNILLDFKENNVHLVGYSEPVRKNAIEKLKSKLHLHESLDDAIPYRSITKGLGFCLTKSILKKFTTKGLTKSV